jgi:hypothetical protein
MPVHTPLPHGGWHAGKVERGDDTTRRTHTVLGAVGARVAKVACTAVGGRAVRVAGAGGRADCGVLCGVVLLTHEYLGWFGLGQVLPSA